MGQAMLQGWLKQKRPYAYSVVDRKFESRTGAAAIYRGLDNLPPNYKADVAVIAIKPGGFAESLPVLKNYLSPWTLVISVAAGQTLSTIDALLGQMGCPLIRAMPNLPGAIGAGITAAAANAHVPSEKRKEAQGWLEALGKVVWLEDESLLNPITAISGSGPAYMFLLVEALAASAERLGLPKEIAAQLARETFIGSAKLLEQRGGDPSDLRKSVASKGGTTEAALDVLMADGGLAAILDRAVKAANDRASELAKKADDKK